MNARSLGVAALLPVASCLPGGVSLTPGIRLYDGPELPPSAVALIENDPNMYLASVDGRSLRRRAHSHNVLTVQVLPGKHMIVAGPSARAGFVSVDAARIEFIAEAGHRYVVSRRIVGGSNSAKWTPVFTDVTTGKELVP
jgi:hypothetical protein